MDNSTERYENDKALRRAVEKDSGVSVTDDEWANLTQNNHPPYDGFDFTEVVNALRGLASQRIRPTSEETAFKYRRGRQDRAVLRLLPLVEALRKDVFQCTMPPFPDLGDVMEPAKWIESRAEPISREYLRLTVSIPASCKPMEALARISSTLTRELAEDKNEVPVYRDGFEAVKRFVDKSEVVEEITLDGPTQLDYLSLNASGEVYVRRIPAPRGSTLGRLRLAADQIAGHLRWRPHAAVHHLFTGLIPDYPLIRATSTHNLFGIDRPLTSKITLEILDPNAVTEQEVAKAYRKAREQNSRLPFGSIKKRSRPSSKSARVAALVQETPDMTWIQRMEEWNRRNPDERYRTAGAMKQAYRRFGHR